MPTRDRILNFSEFDLSHVVADLNDIRRYNPQRFEMEQLSAIVFDDPLRQICVGYKDFEKHEFWIRGQLPHKAELPGMLMCEAAAQCCAYFAQRHDCLGAKMVGFGGMDRIRFHGTALPDERLVIVIQMLKVRRGAMAIFRFQEFVRQTLVCDGRIKGVSLPDILPTG